MLEESLVFHKTQAGANEIATPAHALPPKLRRALIMVDGAKTVAELSAMFRPGEAAAILLELQAKGLVSLSGGVLAKAAEAAPAPEPAVNVSQERFEEIRREAMREISHRLGPNGDALALKVEHCATPQELRVALREAEKILASFLGADVGRTFAQKVGRDLL
jgi:hypothetical protein